MTNAASVLEAARARRSEIQEKTHLDLEIPNTGSLVWARYRPLDYKDIRKIGAKNEVKESEKDNLDIVAEKELLTAKDVLINALIEFRFKDDDGALKPIDESKPVKWKEIAEYLEVDLTENQTSRFIVSQLFSRDMELMEHFGRYSEWSGTTDSVVDEELFTK